MTNIIHQISIVGMAITIYSVNMIKQNAIKCILFKKSLAAIRRKRAMSRMKKGGAHKIILYSIKIGYTNTVAKKVTEEIRYTSFRHFYPHYIQF